MAESLDQGLLSGLQAVGQDFTEVSKTVACKMFVNSHPC